jgi:hypothetical protein
MKPQTMERIPKKKRVYNKDRRYEQNKEEILKYRQEYTGAFTLYFDYIFFCL